MAIAEINEIAKTLRPTALKSKQSPTSVMDSFSSDRSESSPTLKFSEYDPAIDLNKRATNQKTIVTKALNPCASPIKNKKSFFSAAHSPSKKPNVNASGPYSLIGPGNS